jgi:hypothetical protein
MTRDFGCSYLPCAFWSGVDESYPLPVSGPSPNCGFTVAKVHDNKQSSGGNTLHHSFNDCWSSRALKCNNRALTIWPFPGVNALILARAR